MPCPRIRSDTSYRHSLLLPFRGHWYSAPNSGTSGPNYLARFTWPTRVAFDGTRSRTEHRSTAEEIFDKFRAERVDETKSIDGSGHRAAGHPARATLPGAKSHGRLGDG